VGSSRRAAHARIFRRLRASRKAANRNHGVRRTRERRRRSGRGSAGARGVRQASEIAVKIAHAAGICSLVVLVLALATGTARAQDVRVGFFTLHPQAAATISAVSGELRWRACASCKEKSGASVSVRASGDRLIIAGADGSGELQLSGNYRIEAGELPPINLHFPLRIDAREDHLRLSVTMPQEEYVAEVVAAEASYSWKDEALKAMAVAVRTYATRFRGAHEKDGFDFCDTTHCQVVRWNAKNPHARAAAEATEGEILQFDGA